MPHTRVSSHAQASTSHYSQTAGLPTVSLNQRCRSYSLQHQQEARTLQTIASAPSAFSPLERFQAATQRCVAKIGAVSLAAVIGLSSCGTPVQASIPTTELIRGPDLEASGQMGSSRVLPNSAVGTGFLPRSAVVQQKGRAPVIGDKQRAEMAIGLLQDAREGSDAGNYIKALSLYSQVIREYPDFALSEYARMGQALMLYQVGRTSDAILALEDEEVALRGYAEVHVALAAVLYTERPGRTLRAEQEYAIANAFDTRYKDVEWVRANKHWPPKAIAALRKFLTLT